MRINIPMFQEGGAMPPQGGAPEAPEQGGAPAPEEQGGEPQGGEDPIMQIAQMAAQALQSGDCQAAMQVCQTFMQLVQQSQGGGEQQKAPQGEPVYRKGGKLVKRICK